MTADLLKRLGMKVDFVATDWGTLIARRSQKSPPAQGGWHILLSWTAGDLNISPATNGLLRASGENAFSGWANSPPVEAEIAGWFDAKTLDEEKTVARRPGNPGDFFVWNQAVLMTDAQNIGHLAEVSHQPR